MILQALSNLHGRLSKDPANGLAADHHSIQEISIKIVILPNGECDILDFREPLTAVRNGKEIQRLKPREIPVLGSSRASEASFEPCFLWDDTRFALGWHGQKNDPVRNEKCHRAFVDMHLELEQTIKDQDFSAVCNFLRKWKPSDVHKYPDLLKLKKGRVVFQVSGQTQFVHQSPAVIKWFTSNVEKNTQNDLTGQCLISGKTDQTISRLHPGIKNFPGSPYTGASIVSFNDTAYESYGKNGKDIGRGANSPVSTHCADAYAAALDWLLSEKQRERKFSLSDSVAVFWTDEQSQAETIFPWTLSGPPAAEDDETKKRIRNLLMKIRLGYIGSDLLGDPAAIFYLLGLSLNQGRLCVRFWHTGTVGELTDKVRLHLSQLEIVRQWDESNSKRPDPIAPHARDLLQEIVPLKDGRRDESKLPPQLAGALMRSIVTGVRYPDALAQGVINRIRILEKKPKGEGTFDHVTYLRAAILKAWLLRNHNEWLNHQNIQMTTALDKNNISIAYQLGRLFAIYEQAQRAAHEFKLERTIRETMFSSACATPLAVFVRLDKLNKHHLMKLKKGTKAFLSSLIDEIHQKVHANAPLPSALDLKGQSLFCIGYYHQRYDLRPKSPTMEPQTV